MRISDWSSDVCSSDLAGAPMMPDDPAVGEIYDLLGLTRPPERMEDMDLSLNPGRGDPGKPDPDDDMEDNPEDELAKRRVLRSRTNMARSEEHTSELQSLMRT